MEFMDTSLYNVYQHSNNLMCIYDKDEDIITNLNPVGKLHCQNGANLKVEVIMKSENDKYVAIDDIPCKLSVLCHLRVNIALMTMNLAHSKKWAQVSDLVFPTDITSDGVWEWFPVLNFEYMSERFWSILGYTQEDMEENPGSWMGFLNPEDRTMVQALCKDHIDSRGKIPYFCQARYTHKDGREVVVLCRGAVVDWMPDGKPWRILGTHTDITEVVKKDAVEAKTKFISRMSHEIRSPVCAILNECELIRGGDTSVIRETCRQLIALTDDILNIGKLKNTLPVVNAKKDKVQDLLSRSMKRHRVAAKKKGIKIRSIVDDVPTYVIVDSSKFGQVLDNLIGNSLKYTEKSAATIVLDLTYDDDTSICSVRIIDQGIGMEPGFHTKAFEELVQGDGTMIGCGIGLTLSRILATVMGGNVVIEKSALLEGTTILFTSFMPPYVEETVDDGNGVVDDDGCLETVNVLIVDDMKTNRVLLKDRLKNLFASDITFGRIVEAENGQHAVDEFCVQNGDFQLILMDCHMPIMDGFDATQKLHDICREMGRDAVPVVAVTASVSQNIHDKCKLSGMQYVVTKPYSEIELITSIKSCLAFSM